MSESPHNSRADKPTMTESPWFWVMVFSAAGMMFLLAFSPKYAARQRQLEMQYYAREEITRRQVEGATAAPGPARESPPPAPGELIIPLWPLMLLCAAICAVSAARVWRVARPPAEAANSQGKGTEP